VKIVKPIRSYDLVQGQTQPFVLVETHASFILTTRRHSPRQSSRRPLLLPSLESALRAASSLLSDFVWLNCAHEFGDAFDN
jgi:hypothetical protein